MEADVRQVGVLLFALLLLVGCDKSNSKADAWVMPERAEVYPKGVMSYPDFYVFGTKSTF